MSEESDGHLEMACIAVGVAMSDVVGDLLDSGLRSAAVGAAVLREAAMVAAQILTQGGNLEVAEERIDGICASFRQGLTEAIHYHGQTRH